MEESRLFPSNEDRLEQEGVVILLNVSIQRLSRRREAWIYKGDVIVAIVRLRYWIEFKVFLKAFKFHVGV